MTKNLKIILYTFLFIPFLLSGICLMFLLKEYIINKEFDKRDLFLGFIIGFIFWIFETKIIISLIRNNSKI